MNTIDKVIFTLENAKRAGNATDSPEGSRYIMISDTLVNEILEELKLLTPDSN